MTHSQTISFDKIAPRNGSQDEAFEEFCCQVARHWLGVPSGSEFIRYRGAGGDGGVECIWRLPDGDEWGLQAKYIFDLSKALTDAGNSLTTAIAIHPRLTRYTVCFPFDLTGPTGRKGKNQRQVFEERRAEWVAAAKAVGIGLEVSLETPSTLLDALHAFDPQGGRLRFWFDATILGDEWFQAHLESAMRSAGPRYTPELSVETPIARAFDAFGRTDAWFESLSGYTRELKKLVAHWRECVARKAESGWSGAPFPEGLRTMGEDVERSLSELYELLHLGVDLRGSEVDPALLAECTEATLERARAIRGELASELDARFGEGSADSKSFRQFQAEYQCSFPASNVDAADETIDYLERLSGVVCSRTAFLPYARSLTMVGAAGVGKTHSICDAACHRHTRGLRTIVLFGARFSGASEPWEQVRQQLGFDGTLGREAMLAALDAAGEASGKPLLICIDGLNETRPRDYWRHHLPAMMADVERFSWIKIAISCRSTYESQVLPDQRQGVVVCHEGFAGAEFDACREFFEHFDLEPPVVPTMLPEFSNPLFLKLVCKAMVAAGLKRLPIGWHGLSGAINALIQEKNNFFSIEKSCLSNYRYPERGLMSFVEELEKQKRAALPLSIADKAIESVLGQSNLRGTLTEWLVREEMLIVDADPNPAGVSEDLVRIAFDRLGDHLLAARYLERVDAVDPRAAFDAGGALAFAVESPDVLEANAGLVEALTVQVPEKFGVEVWDLLSDRVDISRRLVEITATTLPWRDPSGITEATCRVMERALRLHGFSGSAFDAALSISAIPSAADAHWLHRVLARPRMSVRDGFWCGYLHQSYDEHHGPVEKLIRVAFQVDPATVPMEIVERWAMMLIWFCAAADRRVRDHATKALVRITGSFPRVWAALISRLEDIDDEYVVERGLAAAYGVLLRTRDHDAETAVARDVHRLVFGDPSRFENAAIRDYARSILELAALDQALPSHIAESSYMPPYQSEWPLRVPDPEEVEAYNDSHERYPRIYHSCINDDFNKYTMSRLSDYEHLIDRRGMGRWIFNEVLEMGYGKQHVNYDGYMLYKHGGGRARVPWAERIGKKYQWIAMARLAARLADNAKPKRSRWDTKPLRTPLTYMSGRDTDPSLLISGPPTREADAAWWVPETYNFPAVAGLSHDEWVNRHDDLPSSESILGERSDRSGAKWMVLESALSWREGQDEDDDERRSYRLVWMNIQSYLVSVRRAEAFWKWLITKNFMGRWMPEGTEYHEGFVGEYPWATPFNQYKESFEPSFGCNEKLPCRVVPTCNSLTTTSDSYQLEADTVRLPARRFFEADSLRWDGVSGYRTSCGRHRFLDPSVCEPGPGTLLVDPSYLREFLAACKLAIVWTVLGEKLRIGNNADTRLTYNRVHMIKNSEFRTSDPHVIVE